MKDFILYGLVVPVLGAGCFFGIFCLMVYVGTL